MIVSVGSSLHQISLAVRVVCVTGLQNDIAAGRVRVHTIELNVLLLSAAVGGETHRIGVVISHAEGREGNDLIIQLSPVRVQKSESGGTNGGDREPEVSFSLHVIPKRWHLQRV